MSDLTRRSFFRRLGQGAAVLGLSGLSVKTSGAQAKDSTALKPVPDWKEWEFYYPGKYDAEDAKILSELQAEIAKINNKGKVNISDLVGGKLKGQPGILNETKITAENIKQTATAYGANNPMWLDKDYAKKTKWGAMALPYVGQAMGASPAMPKAKGFADYMVVSHYNVSMSFYKPLYEGDTIYSVADEENSVDITPPQGSHYRTFIMSGSSRSFNQKGELVGEGASIITETFRRNKDKAKRNKDGAHAWESPDWWSRPAYVYTDEDWKEIIRIWKGEKIRGAEALYWDDVNIGDEPPPRAVGPVGSDEVMDMLGLMAPVPQWSVDNKLSVLDPKTFAKMVKNKQGIYVLPEHLEKKPAAAQQFTGAGTDAPMTKTPELSNRDGRAVLMNAVCAQWAGGMIMNWIGDAGWLQRIGWAFMEMPPGFTWGVRYDNDPTMIPSIPAKLRPALFDKYPYLDKVPKMNSSHPAWHPMEGDLIICKAQVTDKYVKDKEHFVDLAWWCETFDKYLVEEGFATVKLPKKA